MIVNHGRGKETILIDKKEPGGTGKSMKHFHPSVYVRKVQENSSFNSAAILSTHIVSYTAVHPTPAPTASPTNPPTNLPIDAPTQPSTCCIHRIKILHLLYIQF